MELTARAKEELKKENFSNFFDEITPIQHNILVAIGKCAVSKELIAKVLYRKEAEIQKELNVLRKEEVIDIVKYSRKNYFYICNKDLKLYASLLKLIRKDFAEQNQCIETFKKDLEAITLDFVQLMNKYQFCDLDEKKAVDELTKVMIDKAVLMIFKKEKD